MKAKNITLRQHYAGLAMQALIGKSMSILQTPDTGDRSEEIKNLVTAVCNGAWMYADMMIERESQQVSDSVWSIAINNTDYAKYLERHLNRGRREEE